MPTALVTGATGMVGHHVAERLLRDGWSVRALVRDPSRAGELAGAGVILRTGDTLDGRTFTAAARGCDVVVHAAAAITPRGGWEAYRQPNVDGTRHAVAAAAGAGARLVHVSSVAVYGGASRYRAEGRRTDEDAPLAALADGEFYARSKRDSEALVMEAHAAGRVWATAVRPCVVYGPHDRQFVPRMARLIRRGVVPMVHGGRSTMSVVHAANVADGIVRAAVTDGAGGRAYNLANDFDVSVREFFTLGAGGLGVRLRTVPLPYPLARAAMGVALAVASLAGSRLGALGSATLDFIARDNPFSSERARRELGWSPFVRPEDGVPDAFRWAAAHPWRS